MPGDFVVMGGLLFGAGLAVQLALQRLSRPLTRRLTVLGVILVVLLIWAELAVDAVSQILTGLA